MNLYFKNIRVIDPNENKDFKTNLWIKNGVIKSISTETISLDSDTEIVESDDIVAAPGFIDMHAEIGEPGYEYKENFKSASESALNGGFTEVVMMPSTEPVIDNATIIDFVENKTKKYPLNIYIAGALTKGLQGEHITEMLEMSDAGALMFTNGNKSLKSTETLRNAFDYASSKDLLIALHSEDSGLTKKATMNEGPLSYRLGLKGYPSIAEEIMVYGNIKMAEYTGNRRLHLQHISTAGSIELLKDAKSKGFRVSGEVAPQYFILDESFIKSYNTNYKMNPPLRTKNDISAIIDAVKDGILDVIVSDHQPAALHEKDVEYENAPDGIINFETVLGLSVDNLYHKHKIDLMKIISLFTTNPRNILQLDQIVFEEGKNANITFFKPDEEWIVENKKFKSKSTNNPFNNYKLKGKPYGIIVNNKFVKSEL